MHRWQDCNRGGTAPDNDNLFFGVIEVFGPELRVDDKAFETFETRDIAVKTLKASILSVLPPRDLLVAAVLGAAHWQFQGRKFTSL